MWKECLRKMVCLRKMAQENQPKILTYDAAVRIGGPYGTTLDDVMCWFQHDAMYKRCVITHV